MPSAEDPGQPTSQYSAEQAQSLLEACEAALVWVEAMERDDGTVNLDAAYWHWLERMRQAVAEVQRADQVAQ